ncbi:hypothetical protein N9S62_01285 [Pelagibacteraceae bacterium]|nr:hypothetical protein [Pelagibacteraceae bacterium]
MIGKLKKINFFILTLSILFFLFTSLVKSDEDLEKNYNDFVKETRSIRNQLNSLPASNSVEVSVIDSAIKEMDRAVEFAQENFKTNDFEITEKTLNFVDKGLADINSSVPKEFVNDLTVVDMSKLKDKELKEVYQVSIEMKNNKKEKLTSLVKDMTEVDKKGLNLFEVSKNINDIGVKTISIQDIAKTVVENPSIKSEVLESAEKGISPEHLAEQLAEAEKLGIAESTEKLSEAAMASGFNKDVMPSLETMRGDFFDADAHNAAMAEMAEDIQEGGIGEGVGAAEAAASYTEADRDAQKAQSEADCGGSCGETESGD